jgi:hypothetical protein
MQLTGERKKVDRLEKKFTIATDAEQRESSLSLFSSVPISAIQFSSHPHIQFCSVPNQPNAQLQNSTKVQHSETSLS